MIPVDVKRIGVDFLTGGVLEVAVRRTRVGAFCMRRRPRASATRRRSRAGRRTVGRSASRARWTMPTVRRAGCRARPSIPALYASTEGPRLVRRAGIDAIRAKSIRQTSRLIELADERGYTVRAPRDTDRRGGTVAFDVPHAYEVAQFLLSRDIIVDYRPNAGIRIAPHFYTSDAELERAVAAMDEALATGAWQQFGERRSVVT